MRHSEPCIRRVGNDPPHWNEIPRAAASTERTTHGSSEHDPKRPGFFDDPIEQFLVAKVQTIVYADSGNAATRQPINAFVVEISY